ncbi:hypothetical protein [Xenorhabdus sp. SGI246]|uniref:hypothetical protein n=1 Tax=Xenorhabdus sp. SGI246 TaxID=3158263 RepID=UPI00349F1806
MVEMNHINSVNISASLFDEVIFTGKLKMDHHQENYRGEQCGNLLIIRECEDKNKKLTGRNVLAQIIKIKSHPDDSMVILFKLVNYSVFFCAYNRM